MEKKKQSSDFENIALMLLRKRFIKKNNPTRPRPEGGELARRLHLLGRLKIVAGIETWAQPDASNWQLYPTTANGPLDS